MSEMPEPTVLIVDDDLICRDNMARLFHVLRRDCPCRVLQANDGEQAMKILETHPVDCVFLDYLMSGGTGLEWLPKIVAKWPDMPVILVTGMGSEQIAVDAMKQGALDYLVKGQLSRETLHRAFLNAQKTRELKNILAQQSEKLLQAERQRVMMESFGAVCHHFSQPLTVLGIFLRIVEKQLETENRPDELKAMLAECDQALKKLNLMVQHLQEIHEYQAEVYLQSEPGKTEVNIVRIPGEESG
jgi:ActR/RegA family two-component response regulator